MGLGKSKFDMAHKLTEASKLSGSIVRLTEGQTVTPTIKGNGVVPYQKRKTSDFLNGITQLVDDGVKVSDKIKADIHEDTLKRAQLGDYSVNGMLFRGTQREVIDTVKGQADAQKSWGSILENFEATKQQIYGRTDLTYGQKINEVNKALESQINGMTHINHSEAYKLAFLKQARQYGNHLASKNVSDTLQANMEEELGDVDMIAQNGFAGIEYNNAEEYAQKYAEVHRDAVAKYKALGYSANKIKARTQANIKDLIYQGKADELRALQGVIIDPKDGIKLDIKDSMISSAEEIAERKGREANVERDRKVHSNGKAYHSEFNKFSQTWDVDGSKMSEEDRAEFKESLKEYLGRVRNSDENVLDPNLQAKLFEDTDALYKEVFEGIKRPEMSLKDAIELDRAYHNKNWELIEEIREKNAGAKITGDQKWIYERASNALESDEKERIEAQMSVLFEETKAKIPFTLTQQDFMSGITDPRDPRSVASKNFKNEWVKAFKELRADQEGDLTFDQLNEVVEKVTKGKTLLTPEQQAQTTGGMSVQDLPEQGRTTNEFLRNNLVAGKLKHVEQRLQTLPSEEQAKARENIDKLSKHIGKPLWTEEERKAVRDNYFKKDADAMHKLKHSVHNKGDFGDKLRGTFNDFSNKLEFDNFFKELPVKGIERDAGSFYFGDAQLWVFNKTTNQMELLSVGELNKKPTGTYIARTRPFWGDTSVRYTNSKGKDMYADVEDVPYEHFEDIQETLGNFEGTWMMFKTWVKRGREDERDERKEFDNKINKLRGEEG